MAQPITPRNSVTTVVLPITVDFRHYDDDYFTPEQLRVLNTPNESLTEEDITVYTELVYGLADDIASAGGLDYVIHDSDVKAVVEYAGF